MVRLDNLFTLTPGNDLELCYLTEDDEGVAFVSRTAKNNGISSRVQKIEGIEPFKPGTITVSLGGSVLESFIHEEEYYTGYHIKVLTPIEKMSMEEMQFYCLCIKLNKFKYSYGRQANKTIASLLVPSRDEIPDWVYKSRNIDINSIPDYFLSEGYEKACWYIDNIDKEIFEKKYKPSLCSKMTEKTKYALFDIEELFIVKGSKTTKKDVLDSFGDGEWPYITTRSSNNGVDGYYNYYTEEGNVITIDSATVGFASYQGKNFSASDHVEKLIPRFNLTPSIALYITTIINNENFRYDYGRKFNQGRIKKTKLYLPSVDGGNKLSSLNTNYMEKYISSISYSSSLLDSK